ncbi:hypothetical protein CC77DRAFT_172196 [Alternaria alternata]|uniref:Uncharacterized protein n=1 Tax=Alternaria alternata TaxID=5599 RepID=A0A177DG99_ALTAL|nr:hypothetical protein CC77DRAFT_172196 [Alternaria alternata]OAG18793.1 hypothetical protein CC77DRAFT_172196 [Alternaria alternata]
MSCAAKQPPNSFDWTRRNCEVQKLENSLPRFLASVRCVLSQPARAAVVPLGATLPRITDQRQTIAEGFHTRLFPPQLLSLLHSRTSPCTIAPPPAQSHLPSAHSLRVLQQLSSCLKCFIAQLLKSAYRFRPPSGIAHNKMVPATIRHAPWLGIKVSHWPTTSGATAIPWSLSPSCCRCSR